LIKKNKKQKKENKTKETFPKRRKRKRERERERERERDRRTEISLNGNRRIIFRKYARKMAEEKWSLSNESIHFRLISKRFFVLIL